jgi:two-component system nitrogen regulation response regulator NtrX
VRELRNVVERLMLSAVDGIVDVETVRLTLPGSATLGSASFASGTLAERVQGFEREMIVAELRRSQNNVTNAAKALGLERSHLYKKAEQLGIDLRSLRQIESQS